MTPHSQNVSPAPYTHTHTHVAHTTHAVLHEHCLLNILLVSSLDAFFFSFDSTSSRQHRPHYVISESLYGTRTHTPPSHKWSCVSCMRCAPSPPKHPRSHTRQDRQTPTKNILSFSSRQLARTHTPYRRFQCVQPISTCHRSNRVTVLHKNVDGGKCYIVLQMVHIIVAPFKCRV